MTMRDWRAGELRFLLIALIVAVASLSAVGFFVDRLRIGLDRDAHQLLGADLVVSAERPIPADWRSAAQQRGLRVAATVELSSMALVGAGDDALSRLVSLKAVSDDYPLRGNLKVKKGTTDVVTRETPAVGTAWIDPALLTELDLGIGATLQLGDRQFTVAHIIAAEPDRGAAFMNYVPRVMISVRDLAATNLILNGSWVSYRLLLAGDPKNVAAFETYLKSAIALQKLRGVRVETMASSRSEMRGALDKAEQFLSLVSLLSAMLAALAVAMAARRFMLRHIDACAMLRCLGLQENQVAALYLLEFLLVGIVGSAIGVACGFAGHFVLMEWLGKLVTSDLPDASWLPAVQGIATGLLLLIGFALPSILQLRNVPHNRLIRREQDPPQAAALVSYGLGLGVFVGLLLWQFGDIRVGLLTAAGFLIGILVFAVVAWLGVASLKRLRSASHRSAWRFALADMQRRPAATVMQVVSLALGLMALLLLTVVRGDLMAAWKDATPADAPNHFVINIQPDQKSDIAGRLQRYGQPELYPMIRGRLTQINGKTITADTYAEDDARELANRDFDLSTARDLPPANTITAGHWYRDAGASHPEVSMEEGLAKSPKLTLGDKLRFDVAGESFDVTVTSLRKINWRARRVNFAFLVNPKAATEMPRTWVTALRVPDADTDFVNRLTRDFPNLTVFDIGPIIRQMQSVLDQVSTAVEFLFLFTLASGVLVLYASLAGTQEARMRQAALLRALGATRKQLAQAQWIEYCLIGGLAGLQAAAGATGISWALARFSFHVAWHFSPWLWLAGLAVGATCAVAGGWIGLRKVLRQPPLLGLRDS